MAGTVIEKDWGESEVLWIGRGGGTSEHCSNRNTHSFCNGQVRSILFWCKYALFAHSEVFIINRWKLNSVIIEDS